MDPSYQNVVETGDLVWTLVAYLSHGVSVAVQLGLVGFLLATGLQALLRPGAVGAWARRLGATEAGGERGRRLGGLRVVLGLALLAPLVLAAPMAVSLLASLGAFALLMTTERGLPEADRATGRRVRRAGVAAAAFVALFSLWEREDGLALGAELLSSALHWRDDELAWQLETDPRAPKVGDLAPDFALQDPEGRVQVRLSDFRGHRPVALVFGSYT
jgi:hypothetical protein